MGEVVVSKRGQAVSSLEPGTCLTCLGGGEVSSERGMAVCPDCAGSGRVSEEYRRTELQLRQVEERLHGLEGELGADLAWLSIELRQTRLALLQIMSAAQDEGDSAEVLLRIRFLANEALRLYPVSDDSE